MSSPLGPLVLIANPKSGRGRVGKALPEIERTLRAEGLDYEIVHTTGPGHATTATREALDSGIRYVVAAGGDGTIHEVVNGMVGNDQPVVKDAVLGVVAAGSGSDFVRSFGLPGDAIEAAHHLIGDRTRPIDLGKVTFRDDAGKESVRYFPNIAEAGLGGSVVERASRLPRRLGPAQYLAAFWMVLPRFKQGMVKVVADGETVESRAHNVVVANCRFYGGGMQISPKSEPDDGMLDVLVMVGPKSDAFTTIPKVYKGKHLPHKNMRELRAKRITVESEDPFRIEADGEVLGWTPAIFEVISRPILLKI
jgi:diacylglycerol kinase (ATP)